MPPVSPMRRLLLLLVLAFGPSCEDAAGVQQGSGAQLAALMKARGLTEADAVAALKTYMPTGRKDEYYLFASGGHSGQLLVIGVPSMRILKYVGVFTPEPGQGYGHDSASKDVLKGGRRLGRELVWGDIHHPALSESQGSYDGQFLFLGDKANPRIAVLSLRNFATVQIVASELLQSASGAVFVTPNTEYVIEVSQYPAPLGNKYADLKRFEKDYRGAAIFWKFDRQNGRIDSEKSWAVELPPYMQDLADAGKLDSEGWAFISSFDSERAYGGNAEGKAALESGASQNDMDYLHLLNWRKAEKIVEEGRTQTIAGMRVISLFTAKEEGLLYLVPAPKSPHGVDVSPDGKEVVVSGKLDTHTTVYSVEKLKSLIEQKRFEGRDPYGIFILPFKESIRGQCEVGLGPLNTQFDTQGYAYTSVFLESKVARWSLKDLKVEAKIPTHYNIGHIVIAAGDTVSPEGKYLVAMNKWSIDRFAEVGPLLPQNLQLVDISGQRQQLLYDLPLPLGEPHYGQMIKTAKLRPIDVYNPIGMNAATQERDPFAVEGGKERIERRVDGVHVFMTAVRSHFTPDVVRVKEGETVHLHLTNLEQAKDASHGFTIGSHNLNLSLAPGQHANVDFVADQAGVFPMYCTEFCSVLHLEMAGYFLVEPKEVAP